VEIAIERAMGRLEDELFLLPLLTAARGLAVDVGANRGYYTCVMAGIFRDVVAFEPNPDVIAGIAAMRAANVTFHRCALSSSVGTSRLYVPQGGETDYTGWGSLHPGHFPGAAPITELDVPVRRLDEFGLEGVAIIKIDVEGHEAEVLEGGRATIAASRPVVIVETFPGNRRAVWGFFSQLGYSAGVFENGRLEMLPGGITDYSGSHAMFVFLPSPPTAPIVLHR